MRIQRVWLLAVPAAVLGLLAAYGSYNRPAAAQPPKGNPEGEAIAKRAEAFVDAFHKGDAKAVAGFWLPDGDFTDRDGHKIVGREAIEKAFAEFFAENKGLKLRIDSDSLRFLTPDTAIEDGTTSVLPPDGAPPTQARYTNVHVKKDGEWYLGSVRSSPVTPPGNSENLRGLEWLVGEWAEDGAKGEVSRITVEWAANQNFLTNEFATTFKDTVIGGGTQWIGWDPAAKTIRSWTFHDHGGFGEGTWTRDGDKWTVKTTAVLPDGQKATATDIVTRIDADTLSFQSKDRVVGDKPAPDIKEIRLKRVK